MKRLRASKGLIAIACAAAGIGEAILLPTTYRSTCMDLQPPPSDGCFVFAEPHLWMRFAIAIASAIPLAVLIGGRSVRRWMTIFAAILVPSGIALAVVLPSDICPGQVGAAFCDVPEHAWTRFIIVLGGVVTGAALFAASGLRHSRAMTVSLAVLSGIAVAFFLPSADGNPFVAVTPTLTDHRVGWRLVIVLVAALLGVLDLALGRRWREHIQFKP